MGVCLLNESSAPGASKQDTAISLCQKVLRGQTEIREWPQARCRLNMVCFVDMSHQAVINGEGQAGALNWEGHKWGGSGWYP
eukprot:1159146-Pelagomonas_calceolata.AAC.11